MNTRRVPWTGGVNTRRAPWTGGVNTRRAPWTGGVNTRRAPWTVARTCFRARGVSPVAPKGSLREGETTWRSCCALPGGRSVSGLGDEKGLCFACSRRPRPLAWAVLFQAVGLNGGAALRPCSGRPEHGREAAFKRGPEMPVAGNRRVPGNLGGNELPSVGDSSNIFTGGTAGREAMDEKSAKAVAEALGHAARSCLTSSRPLQRTGVTS